MGVGCIDGKFGIVVDPPERTVSKTLHRIPALADLDAGSFGDVAAGVRSMRCRVDLENPEIQNARIRGDLLPAAIDVQPEFRGLLRCGRRKQVDRLAAIDLDSLHLTSSG